MKTIFLSSLILVLIVSHFSVFSQTGNQAGNDTTLLGLPGDNLDLYAVLDLFQKSKTIEDFEKSLNSEKTGINNLDLDLDEKVDFIKVVTKQNGEDFTFILQVDVSKTEKQDVAVILVSKDKNKKVTMQIVGDKDLYGKNYIVEPKTTATPAVTANPGYTGAEPVPVTAPASTTTVVIESAPIVQYVYSPVYVPYVPPYHYGYYPPYFAAFTVMAVGVYRHNNYYYHGGGYGYHGNTTVIHNTNVYNNYNISRNSSNTVNRNNASGNYNRNNASTRPAGGGSATTRPSAGTSDHNRKGGSGSATTRPSAGTSDLDRKGGSGSAATRPSGGASASTRQTGPSSSNRQSGQSVSHQQSGPSSSGSYSGGGGGRSGSGYSGGSRGGGRR